MFRLAGEWAAYDLFIGDPNERRGNGWRRDCKLMGSANAHAFMQEWNCTDAYSRNLVDQVCIFTYHYTLFVHVNLLVMTLSNVLLFTSFHYNTTLIAENLLSNFQSYTTDFQRFRRVRLKEVQLIRAVYEEVNCRFGKVVNWRRDDKVEKRGEKALRHC